MLESDEAKMRKEDLEVGEVEDAGVFLGEVLVGVPGGGAEGGEAAVALEAAAGGLVGGDVRLVGEGLVLPGRPPPTLLRLFLLRPSPVLLVRLR